MQEKTKLIYNIGKDATLENYFGQLHEYIEDQVLTHFKEKEKELVAKLGTNQIDESDLEYLKLTMMFEYQTKAAEKLEEAYIFVSKSLTHI